MVFVPPKESYPGKVYPVHIGTDQKSVAFGGENVLPFHSFEGITPNKPVVAYEIQDVPLLTGLRKYRNPTKMFRTIRYCGQNSVRIS